jgi:hypothetical protein
MPRSVDTTQRPPRVYRSLGLAQQQGLSPFVNPVIARKNISSSQFDSANSWRRLQPRLAGARIDALGYPRQLRGEPDARQQLQVLGNANLDANSARLMRPPPEPHDRRRVESRTARLTLSGIYRI